MKKTTRRLCESGIFIALATVLSILKIFEFSFGGSITVLSMLPIVLLSYRHGVKWGLICGFSYSIIQMLLGVNTISVFVLPGESQMVWWRVVLMCLLDYVLAYTVPSIERSSNAFSDIRHEPFLALSLSIPYVMKVISDKSPRYEPYIISKSSFVIAIIRQ